MLDPTQQAWTGSELALNWPFQIDSRQSYPLLMSAHEDSEYRWRYTQNYPGEKKQQMRRNHNTESHRRGMPAFWK